MSNYFRKNDSAMDFNNSIWDKMTIKKRVNLLVIFSLLFLFIFSTAFFAWSLQNNLYQQKAKQIEYATELTFNFLKSYVDDVKAGRLTTQEAQRRAKERLQYLKYDNGKNYVWINDYSGVMLAHTANPKLIGKNLKTMTNKQGKYLFVQPIDESIEKGLSLLKYSWTRPGEDQNKLFKKYSYFRRFEDWKWLVATGVYVDDVHHEVNGIIFKSLIINLIILVLATIIGNMTIGRSITQPIEKLTKLSADLANNDLNLDIPHDENKTEIGELNRSFKKFVDNLSGLIKQITSVTEDISASSEEMSASSEQTAEGALQTATSTSQLAEGAQEISRNVEQGATNIGKMNKVIQGVSEEAKLVAKLGNDTEVNANEGAEYVKKAVDKIDSIKTVSEDISVNITELGKLSSEIEEIVDLIKNIAGQTNLLALNAAIEAARAGEHGKGFAVVADEVKKLAGQSADATEKITTMIQEIQNKTQIAVSTMNKATQEVEEGVFVINDAGKALENIITQVKSANVKIQGITKEIDGVARNSEEMVQMIENISAITEETAASAEEISSITQQQTASMQEISSSAQTLAGVAEKLTGQVAVFKV